MPACPTCGQPLPPRVTARQRDVLALLAEGLTLRQMAARLHISVKTIEAHLAHLKVKADTTTQTGLVRWAMREGLVAMPGKEDEP